MSTMRQCRLRRGPVEQTAWIPTDFAKPGKYVRIRQVNGWRVEAAYGPALSEAYVVERGTDYRHQREASDI